MRGRTGGLTYPYPCEPLQVAVELLVRPWCSIYVWRICFKTVVLLDARGEVSEHPHRHETSMIGIIMCAVFPLSVMRSTFDIDAARRLARTRGPFPKA